MRLPRTSVPNMLAVDDEEVPSDTSADTTLRLVDSTSAIAAPNGNEAPDGAAEEGSLRNLLQAVLAELRSHRGRNTRVVVKTGGKVLFLRAEQIEWVEAAGNYVRLHAAGESYLFRESMKNMETRLDTERFVRIHRSAIVNVDHIRELQPWFHGEYVVLLQDGTRLMASRVFSDRLSRLIA